MEEVSLREMLDAREARVKHQQQLLDHYGATLLCFTMNIPGPVKVTPLIRRGFRLGQQLLKWQLQATGVQLVHFEETLEKTGCEAFYVLACNALTAKQIAVTLEDHTDAGRLYDMDVLRPDGTKVDRAELGLEPRKCLICGRQAQSCARSRAHPVQALQEQTDRLLTSALATFDARRTARLACQALLYEVAVTPKPGLVDRANSGSHRDMDFFSFQASAAALWPYFERCTQVGQETRDLSPRETLARLRGPGRLAEGEMLRATGGVNTHKGAIFSLGLLCAALGRLGWTWAGNPQALLAECASMAAGLAAADFAGLTAETAKTPGQKLFLQHGITGVRGQAEAGFPAVGEIGLPKLEEGLKQGLSLNEAGCAALLALMSAAEDTNLIARSDHRTQQRIARDTAALLQENPFPDEDVLTEMDARFIARNLSPGGTADLLAMTLFLHLVKEETTPENSV